MKKIGIVLLLFMTTNLIAQNNFKDETEIIKLIQSNWEINNKGNIDVRLMSEDGYYAFNSTGGLMVYDKNPNIRKNEWDAVSLTAKHIKVVSLVPGEAAVAMYYSEGSMTPKGSAAVPHYMTRVTEVFIKEKGKWVMKTAHYSPISSGSGTSQVGPKSQDNK
ncbi:MAG: hypothetical protein ACJAVE_000440 [Polaribacter sp.]|jgi:hypothetical protein|tara:strand:- start:757 stop:1242 length:486 start_codon:yes stop_codon:yes gene_type:complete